MVSRSDDLLFSLTVHPGMVITLSLVLTFGLLPLRMNADYSVKRGRSSPSPNFRQEKEEQPWASVHSES